MNEVSFELGERVTVTVTVTVKKTCPSPVGV
jgi:hypothetical protein